MEKKVIFGSLLMLSTGLLTGCAGQFFTPYDNAGRISLNADEKGLQAFSDMVIGLTNEARTPAGQKSSHYQLRQEQVSWKDKFRDRFAKGGVNYEQQ